MKIILTSLILILSFSVRAQPGYIDKLYNVNDLPEDYVIQNQKQPHVYRLTIVIDFTSNDFSKLNLLKNHNELTFDIRTESLPKEFNSVVFDSINKLIFLCNGITKDLSNIKGFKHVKEFIINNFSGEKIPKQFKEFKNLESLHINISKNINDIDALKNVKKLKIISLDCSSLNKFPTFSKSNPIGQIMLNGVHNNLDFRNLSSLQKLGGIEITIPMELKDFPDYLPKNLKQIKVNGNILSLSNLTLYPNVEYIQIESTHLVCFDIDFKGNNSIKNIGIDNNPILKNIDAIYTCNGLEYLSLNELPALKEFDLKNLNLKKGLSIQATGLTTVKPIEKIKEFSYLYICHNDYLKIDIEPKNPNSSIFDNGRLLKE